MFILYMFFKILYNSLPPSFPFGGMENPCLTFVTPVNILILCLEKKIFFYLILFYFYFYFY